MLRVKAIRPMVENRITYQIGEEFVTTEERGNRLASIPLVEIVGGTDVKGAKKEDPVAKKKKTPKPKPKRAKDRAMSSPPSGKSKRR